MKHSLKISSFIIFAAIVASVFTSCGNDSELFDEPVMFQTRAMAGMDTRQEPLYTEVLKPDSGTKEVTIIPNKVYAQITVSWKEDSEVRVKATFDPICYDNSYFIKTPTNNQKKEYYHFGKAGVVYELDYVYQIKYDGGGNPVDTISVPIPDTLRKPKVEFEVEYDKVYY